MDKMKFETPDLTAENVAKIAELFPGAVAEGKVNFDLLRSMLGEDVFGDEAYEFTWVGKRAAIAEAGRPIRKTLRPCVEESKNWDTTENLYIEGDNLDVLKLLQEGYLSSVDMIFIDPPYNTGSDAFIYNDVFEASVEEFEETVELRDEYGNIRFKPNSNSNPRFHSNWLSMIYPRLSVARNMLSERGVVFICIDDNEHANLKSVCDEVFGARCFIGNIVWRSSDNSNNNALTFSEDHNYILVYAKSPFWRPNFLNDPQKRSHFKNPDNDPKGPWFDGNPVNNPGLRVNLQYDITTPSGRVIKHPPNGWRWSRETIQEKLQTGELRFSADESRLIRRTYLCDMEGLPPSSLCIDFNVTGHTRKAKYELKSIFPEVPVTSLFSTPKPTLLIKYLLTIGSQQDSVVLDFFSGSASTAHAIMQLNQEDGGNRKFIMVQIEEPCNNDSNSAVQFANICEIGKERIRRAGEKIKEEAGLMAQNLDIGFRVLKLDDTNMTDVYYAPSETTQDLIKMMESNIKPDRTDMDLLYGCLLDWGLPLSMPHTHEEIDGFTVHTYNDGDLIACFDERISEKAIREIAERKPLRAVFCDSGFTSSPEKINVFEIFKLLAPNTTVKVI